MGSAPSKTSATAGSPMWFDYEVWVRRQPDISADALILEKPESDTVARIEDARARNIETIVTGFLPDEIDWPSPSWNETLGFFVERFQFTPRRLTAPATQRIGGGRVLGITDRPDLAVAGLAAGCAEIVDQSAENVVLGKLRENDLVAEIARSSLVMNGSSNWALGFAVDELAARLGASVMRLCNPGYSPLRYAVLGVELPPAYPVEIPRLRRALTVLGWPSRRGMNGAQVAAWYDSSDATGRWGSLYDSYAHSKFWAGIDLNRLHGARSRGSGRWLNQTCGWPALAAFEMSSISSDIRHSLEATVARWVVAEQRIRASGAIREAALARWVRLHPEWIDVYRREAGDVREARRTIAAWAKRAAAWSEAPISIGPLVKVAASALDKESRESDTLALVAAWGFAWPKVMQIAPRVQEIDPDWRSVCVELCWTRLELLATDHAKRSEEAVAIDELLAQTTRWSAAMGAAGSVLRIIAAIRLRRRGTALEEWRANLRAGFLGTSGGWLRLIRVAFEENGAIVAWLQELSCKDANGPGTVVAGIVASWFAYRVRELWRNDRSRELEQELCTARRLLARCCRLVPDDRAVIHLAARLAAFEDDNVAAAAAVHEYAYDRSDSAQELPAAVALIHARRGMRKAAESLLLNWRVQGGAAFPLFLEAMVWLMLDNETIALQRMQAVLRVAPHFFRDECRPGAHWALMAIALRRVGLTEDAERFLGIAMRQKKPSAQFIDFYSIVEPDRCAQEDEWRRLVRQ